jgi:hypothetical protein
MTTWARLHCPWAGPFYARAGEADIETSMGQKLELAGHSSNLTSKQGETREQGRDYPPNKRTILGYPLQHGERDGESELRTPNSAGQFFALSGHMATRRAQTSAPERGWACFHKRRMWRLIDGRSRGGGGCVSALLSPQRRPRSARTALSQRRGKMAGQRNSIGLMPRC